MEVKDTVVRWLDAARGGLFKICVAIVLATILFAYPVAALLAVLIYMVWKSRNDSHLFERVGAKIDQFLRGSS